MVQHYPKKFLILIFFLFFCCASASFYGALRVFAETTTTSLTITNSAPAASNVEITVPVPSNGAISLTPGTTTSLTATFTVTDYNGCADIDSSSPDTSAIFYRTDVTSGISCTPDDANCYTLSCTQDENSCTGSDNDATYTCTGSLQFYADATDSGSEHELTNWTVGVIPADNEGAATANTDYTIEINSLVSHTIDASINYSSLGLGTDTGAADQPTLITNKGNRTIDVTVGGYGTGTGDGYAMSCTTGNIDVAYEKFSTSASTEYASKTALNADTPSPNSVNLNIAPGSSSSSNIYWGMGVPTSGVSGTCSGSIVSTSVGD